MVLRFVSLSFRTPLFGWDFIFLLPPIFEQRKRRNGQYFRLCRRSKYVKVPHNTYCFTSFSSLGVPSSSAIGNTTVTVVSLSVTTAIFHAEERRVGSMCCPACPVDFSIGVFRHQKTLLVLEGSCNAFMFFVFLCAHHTTLSDDSEGNKGHKKMRRLLHKSSII